MTESILGAPAHHKPRPIGSLYVRGILSYPDPGMQPKRTIYCSNCGCKLTVPMSLQPGRKVKCGACGCVFPVPPVMTRREKPPTVVGQYNIKDLPTSLQDAMGAADQPTSPPRRPAPRAQPKPQGPQPGTGADGPRPARGPAYGRRAARKAFDLDKKNNPAKRTGVGMINVKDLPLPPDWDEE